MLIIEHSEILKIIPNYSNIVRYICKKALESILNIAVKYHPRENNGDYCSIKDLSGNKNFTSRYTS